MADVTAHGNARYFHGISRVRLTYSKVILLLAAVSQVSAHNGPPFAIVMDRKVGPCIISVWAHPDVGIGTFYVVVDPPPGGTIPKDLKVQIGIQPVTGRLPEAMYPTPSRAAQRPGPLSDRSEVRRAGNVARARFCSKARKAAAKRPRPWKRPRPDPRSGSCCGTPRPSPPSPSCGSAPSRAGEAEATNLPKLPHRQPTRRAASHPVAPAP